MASYTNGIISVDWGTNNQVSANYTTTVSSTWATGMAYGTAMVLSGPWTVSTGVALPYQPVVTVVEDSGPSVPEPPKSVLPKGFEFKVEEMRCSKCGRRYARGHTECKGCGESIGQPQS